MNPATNRTTKKILDKLNSLSAELQRHTQHDLSNLQTKAFEHAEQAMTVALDESKSNSEKNSAVRQFQQQADKLILVSNKQLILNRYERAQAELQHDARYHFPDLLKTLFEQAKEAMQQALLPGLSAKQINRAIRQFQQQADTLLIEAHDQKIEIENKKREMGLLKRTSTITLLSIEDKIKELQMPAGFVLTALELAEHQRQYITRDKKTLSDRYWISLLDAIKSASDDYKKKDFHIGKDKDPEVDRQFSIDVLEDGCIAFNTDRPISQKGSYKIPYRSDLFLPHNDACYPMVRFKQKTDEGKRRKGQSQQSSTKESTELQALFRVWEERRLALSLPNNREKNTPRFLFAEGVSLYQYLNRTSLDHKQRLEMLLQITEDLICLGRPHRDINTNNIIIIENACDEIEFVLNDVGSEEKPSTIVSSYTNVSINELSRRLMEESQALGDDFSSARNDTYYLKHFLQTLFPSDETTTTQHPITAQLQLHFPKMSSLLEHSHKLPKSDNDLVFVFFSLKNHLHSELSASSDLLAAYHLRLALCLIKTKTDTDHEHIERILATFITPEAIFQQCATYFTDHFQLPYDDRWKDDQDTTNTSKADIYALGLIAGQPPAVDNAAFNALKARMLSPRLSERPDLETLRDEIQLLLQQPDPNSHPSAPSPP